MEIHHVYADKSFVLKFNKLRIKLSNVNYNSRVSKILILVQFLNVRDCVTIGCGTKYSNDWNMFDL